MIVEQCRMTGAWRISDIICGHLKQMNYMGYTKEEAIEQWNAIYGVQNADKNS